MAHEHDHQHDDEETLGLALGVRILEDEGDYYLVEAEVAPYVDEPDELGVTLVFTPLRGLDPLQVGNDVEWPSWQLDFDDDLVRDGGESMEAQFASIVRQLHDLKTGQLRDYLRLAREEAAEGEIDG